MKVKGKIIQIIKWEERGNYLFKHYFNEDGKFDLLNIIIEGSGMMNPIHKKIFMAFREGFNLEGRPETPGFPMYFNRDNFTSWQKRPHNFKEGDKIEIELKIKKVKA